MIGFYADSPLTRSGLGYVAAVKMIVVREEHASPRKMSWSERDASRIRVVSPACKAISLYMSGVGDASSVIATILTKFFKCPSRVQKKQNVSRFLHLI